jgi:hypothetical protein
MASATRYGRISGDNTGIMVRRKFIVAGFKSTGEMPAETTCFFSANNFQIAKFKNCNDCF